MPGPFYFAWVNATDKVWNPSFAREDEDIFSFTLEHTEGEFAAIQATIRNPRIGLLAPGRKVWAWFSWLDGIQVRPLFFGRLVGIPSDIHAELVQLEFSARPKDYVTQKEALAASLRVAPYYDEIWLDEQRRLDPDVVLEARPELWHTDRITHVLTTSDVLVGEDGTYDFPNNRVFYDSVKITLNQVPLRNVEVEAKVTWVQSAIGSVEVGSIIHAYWPNKDPMNRMITSFSGDGLLGSWPQPEQAIGGGWSVGYSTVKPLQGLVVADEMQALEVEHGVLTPVNVPKGSIVIPTVRSLVFFAWFLESIVVPLWWLKCAMTAEYDAKRNRGETVKFKLSTDVQPIVTLAEDDDKLLLTLNSVDVGMPIDPKNPASEIPIGDVRRRSFIPTDRGRQALEYLITLARANLVARSRAVEIEFDCLFNDAINLSCRMNGMVHDPRLPGGQAIGKIIAYSFGLDGESGGPFGKVTLGCPIGYGNAVVTNPGNPLYIEDGYIANTMYERDGEIVAVGAGDLAYTVPHDNPQDDGLDFIRGFTGKEMVKGVSIVNGPIVQEDKINQYRNKPNVVVDQAGVIEVLQKYPTTVTLDFVPLTGGPFETPYDIELTKLVIPQGINLEAPSTP